MPTLIDDPQTQRRTELAQEATALAAPSSFDELFLANYSRLVSIVRRVVGDLHRAQDIVSEVFLKLYHRPLPEAEKDNIAGWLYRTAMNLGIDEIRLRARRNRLENTYLISEERSQQSDDGLQALLRAEKQQRVRTALAKLKPAWAELLLLRASGHSYRELAEHFQTSPNSIGTMLIRAESAFEKTYCELFGKEEVL